MLQMVISVYIYVRNVYYPYTLNGSKMVHEFDCAVVYALHQLRCPLLQLKTGQKAARY